MNTRYKFLLRTPAALQSLVTTLGSRLRYHRRFGRIFAEAMRALAANERLSRKELLALQARLINRTLVEARAHVPFYMGERHPCDKLYEWPIIKKETVRREADEFLSKRWHRRSLLRAETSGTSGTPLSVYCTEATYQWEMAFRWRHRTWAGIPFGARGAYLSGHLVVPQERKRPPFWVLDAAENRLLFSSYHLAEKNLESYVTALVKFDPAFVHGYPSSLFLVARAVLRSPRRPRPRAVFAASETLLPHQRHVIEGAFGCKVFAWYGQTEMTVNIVECDRGNLHQREDYGVLETTNTGALGTGLRNYAMPLIRYETGDVIETSEGECECGRPFGLVRSIRGRVEDYVLTPNGSRVGRLDHLFKGAAGVVEAQVLQEATDLIRLKIVRGDGYSAETERLIVRESLARLGAQVQLQFEYVDSIPRGPGGKFRFVVSKIQGPSEIDGGGRLAGTDVGVE